jgi:hypothetical protein
MSKDRRTLSDRLREIIETLGKLLNPKQHLAPAPRPAPVRANDKRVKR